MRESDVEEAARNLFPQAWMLSNKKKERTKRKCLSALAIPAIYKAGILESILKHSGMFKGPDILRFSRSSKVISRRLCDWELDLSSIWLRAEQLPQMSDDFWPRIVRMNIQHRGQQQENAEKEAASLHVIRQLVNLKSISSGVVNQMCLLANCQKLEHLDLSTSLLFDSRRDKRTPALAGGDPQ